MSPDARLPRALEHARALLTDRGPLTPGELASALRAARFVVREDQLVRVVDRWPEAFWLDDLGRLTVVRPPKPSTRDGEDLSEGEDADDGWWTRPGDVEPLPLSRVVVVAIDTTGPDVEKDGLRQIATVNLGTGERMLVDLEHPGDDPDEATDLASALARLDDQLAEADVVAGLLVRRFTVPFLAATARRAGRAWETTLPGIDLHALSLLVDPTLVGRGLVELAAHFDVTVAGVSTADRATATADLLRRLLDRYDPADPTWALARACLVRSGDPLARLLPAGGTVGGLEEALRPQPDDLTVVGEGASHATSTSAVAHAFAVLRARVPGHRDRPSQRSMADEVAAALDRGGRLAVEGTHRDREIAGLPPTCGGAGRPPGPTGRRGHEDEAPATPAARGGRPAAIARPAPGAVPAGAGRGQLHLHP